ncbi:hypothetical protein Agabi119p4_5069 [Agaricus bisporus var. burnettii]|uniref:Uncharacterized protein n=1 Tax=Agaricus bisporus var. burnettii TaxID=192524 RepID=A0A8H7F4G2_AGABI|nr:hypothetical protein Agabi119p4_5069 [Agaricus bisporus var. burnettii]
MPTITPLFNSTTTLLRVYRDQLDVFLGKLLHGLRCSSLYDIIGGKESDSQKWARRARLCPYGMLVRGTLL